MSGVGYDIIWVTSSSSCAHSVYKYMILFIYFLWSRVLLLFLWNCLLVVDFPKIDFPSPLLLFLQSCCRWQSNAASCVFLLDLLKVIAKLAGQAIYLVFWDICCFSNGGWSGFLVLVLGAGVTTFSGVLLALCFITKILSSILVYSSEWSQHLHFFFFPYVLSSPLAWSESWTPRWTPYWKKVQ